MALIRTLLSWGAETCLDAPFRRADAAERPPDARGADLGAEDFFGADFLGAILPNTDLVE